MSTDNQAINWSKESHLKLKCSDSAVVSISGSGSGLDQDSSLADPSLQRHDRRKFAARRRLAPSRHWSKNFYPRLTRGLYYKSFSIVTYNRNDSSLYYKTTILANLTLARSVNHDHDPANWSIPYDRKTFRVQATVSLLQNCFGIIDATIGIFPYDFVWG